MRIFMSAPGNNYERFMSEEKTTRLAHNFFYEQVAPENRPTLTQTSIRGWRTQLCRRQLYSLCADYEQIMSGL